MAMLFEELAVCSSLRLDEWLAALDRVARALLVDDLQWFRARFLELLKAKLSFLLYIPFKALGICWVCCGGEEGVSKRILKECLEGYDIAMAADLPVHRVAHLLWQGNKVSN